MPSSIARRVGRALVARARELRQARIPMKSPWQGYIPDPSQHQVQPDGLAITVGIVVKDGVVTTDDGWQQLDAANLPLGHNGDAAGYDDGSATVAGEFGEGGLGVATAGNDAVQPVIGLVTHPRIHRTEGLTNIDGIAVTGDTGTVGTGAQGVAPWQETGHLFRLDDTGVWESVEFNSQNGDPAAPGVIPVATVASAVPLTANAEAAVDFAIYPIGLEGDSFTFTAATGDTRTINEVPESVLIFCTSNDDLSGTRGADQVCYFPDEDTDTGSTNYSNFSVFAYQCDQAAVSAEAGGPPALPRGGVRPDFTSLKAVTCETYAGRMLYGNTTEDGDRWSQRIRWSKIGNPLIVWPGFEVTDDEPAGAGTAPNNINGVGAGSMDMTEFATEILRIETLGAVAAVYSRDGVAFLRRTNISTAPFYREYISHERGLLSTRSLVNLGGGVHFGLFTDGWYLVFENGTFKEVGVMGEDSSFARAIRGEREQNIIYKWKRDFYGRLDRGQMNRLVANYDPLNKFVRIAAPMNQDEVWIYDIQNDRVYLDDYTNVASQNSHPRSWGNFNTQTATAFTWTNPPIPAGSWDDHAAYTWDELGSSFAQAVPTHGTTGGYVFRHDQKLLTRDGDRVPWNFRTRQHAFGSPSTMTQLARVWVEFRNRQNQITSAIVSASSEDEADTMPVDLSMEDTGEMAMDYADFRIAGHHHTVGMTGTGRPEIHSLEVEVTVEEDEPGAQAIRGEGGA